MGKVMIGVALFMPQLDNILKKYRNKHNKHKDLDVHLTLYHSDYKGYNKNNLKKLINTLKNYQKKVVIDKIKKQGKKNFVYLNVKNFRDFDKLRSEIRNVFGIEKNKNNLHITLGYNVNEDDYNEMKKDIDTKLPYIINGSKCQIVLMDFSDGEMKAKEYTI